MREKKILNPLIEAVIPINSEDTIAHNIIYTQKLQLSVESFCFFMLAQVNYVSSLFTAVLRLQVFKKLAAPPGFWGEHDLDKFILTSLQYTEK